MIDPPWLARGAAGLITLVFAGILWRKSAIAQKRAESRLWLLSLLFIWTLLVAYHRAYDSVLMIVPFLFLANQLWIKRCWAQRQRQEWTLSGLVGALIAVMTVPPAAAGLLLPAEQMANWYRLFSYVMTLSLLGTFGLIAFLPLAETDE
jgi:hypothetical protein